MANGIEVVVQIAGEDVPAGRLWSHRRRGVESATFLYRDGRLAIAKFPSPSTGIAAAISTSPR